jgi:hypothetical protein
VTSRLAPEAVGRLQDATDRFTSSPNRAEASAGLTAGLFVVWWVGLTENICSGKTRKDACGAAD